MRAYWSSLADLVHRSTGYFLAAFAGSLLFAFEVYERFIAPWVPAEWRGLVDSLASLTGVALVGLVLFGVFRAYHEIRMELQRAQQGSVLHAIRIGPDEMTLPESVTPEQITAAGEAAMSYTAATTVTNRSALLAESVLESDDHRVAEPSGQGSE